ncbi:hypothetical protein F5Y08DRAFT_341318 [Xylaria arbuscula]|nr:hypothetical protein F5Y08DRAFT_341318 [Xylaria arbuscula]
MSQPQASLITRAWYQWKSLRLPWRKRIFVGADPQGNTYYILRQPRGDSTSLPTSPERRLVYYPRSTQYSEVKVPPAWHSWLRYQRFEPPSMEEQLGELQRQAQIKLLAAEADARWDAKPSLLDMPGSSPSPSTSTANKPVMGSEGKLQSSSASGGQARDPRERGDKAPTSPDPDPWKQAQAQRGAPGETWQPQAWTPTSTTARRR